ncbi:hypothetical protein QUF90_18995 [Desulfococcaceae bacterium HSG9]|nr:hypothetical protein [Desulfococcaceae bacterium HSG9]
MRIIVCTKQIRHTYARTGKEPDKNYINPEDSIYRVNPYDEAAIELALRLKDAIGQGEVVLLTIGPMIAETEMRRCLATGVDHLFQIELPYEIGVKDPLNQPAPQIKAELLALAIKELKGDLILCGKESADRGNGQIGAFLAHHLDWPFVSAITQLAFNQADGCIQAQRSAGRGVRETAECALPAVCSVDLGTDLRMPTVTSKQWAEKYDICKLSYDRKKPSLSTENVRIFPPRPRPKIIPPPDSRLDAYQRVSQLLTGSTVEKKGDILTGSAESQAEGIIAFLKTYSFLETVDSE